MLKKKIATTITSVTRLCSCGRTVTLAVMGKTICVCGKVIYDAKNDNDNDAKNNNNINGETIHEEAELEAGDSSTESTDSK